MLMRSIMVAVACSVWATAGVVVADSTRPPSASRPKSPKSSTARARDRIAAAQREYTSAVGRVAAARAKLKETMRQTPLVREDVRTYHDSTPALQAARSASEQSRKELDEASRPLLEKVHEEREYQAAVARRDELKKQLQSLPAGWPPARRDELEHELAVAMAHIRKVEKSELESDPDAKELLRQVASDEADLRRLVRRRDADVVHDPRWASALTALTQAKTEFLETQQAVAGSAQKLAAAQQDLARKVAAEEQRKHRKRRR